MILRISVKLEKVTYFSFLTSISLIKMIQASTGLTVENNRTSLGQLSDANGVQLVFTKTVGTVGKISERDLYTATGTPTGARTWAYTAEALTTNPTLLYVTVKKT